MWKGEDHFLYLMTSVRFSMSISFSPNFTNQRPDVSELAKVFGSQVFGRMQLKGMEF